MEAEAETELLPVEFDTLHKNNVGALKKLNSFTFPLNYPKRLVCFAVNTQESIYTHAMDCPATCLAYHTDVLVGAIMCRYETKADGKTACMYIASLGVLPPYRDRGIGTKLLKHALRKAANDSNITDAYLHMQSGNSSAASFYQRHGFVFSHTVPKYYARLDPPDADIWTRSLKDFRP